MFPRNCLCPRDRDRVNSRLPPTRPTLVLRLRNPTDQAAWNTFVEIYAPVVLAYAKRCGLQEADAADVVQEVLRSVYGAAERFSYDPTKGSFRGWLFTIARNRVKHLRRRRIEVTGGTVVREMMASQPDRLDDQNRWEREHQARLFAWAVERVKPDFRQGTWDAFWGVAVDNESVVDVATRLDMTVGAVYVAKSRVVARIRAEIQDIEGDQT